MQTLLIIGAKGMLGQELVQVFSDSYHVIGWDREDIDATDAGECREKIGELRPDIIINAAAYNAVDKAEEEAEAATLAHKLNAKAPGQLAQLAKELGALFVHYSSDYVFAGDTEEGYAEDAQTNPLNVYGKSKAAGEQAVIEHGEKYYIIRLSKLFGKPATSEAAKKSFVDVMLYLATDGGKDHLDLVDEEDSSPTYAPDLAQFTRNLIEDTVEYGIYHGVNSGHCTWYEFAKEVFAIRNIEMSTSPVGMDAFPRPAKRPKHSVLLNTKRAKQRSWQEALKEYLG